MALRQSEKQEIIKEYCLVEFPDEAIDGSLPMTIVPSKWLKNTICFWPKFKTDEERRKAVINKVEFDRDDCDRCNINIKYKSDSYDKAVLKLKFFEEGGSSACSSDSCYDIGKRKAKCISPVRKFLDSSKNRNNYSSDSDSSEDLPPTPPTFVELTPTNFGTSKGSKRDTNTQVTTSSRHRAGDSLTPVTHKAIEKGSASTSDGVRQCEPITSFNSVAKTCQKNKTLLETLHRKLEVMSQDITFLIQITKRNTLEDEGIAAIPDGISFPISKVEEIKTFNNRLSDEEFFKNICASLLNIGGKDVNDGTRRLLGTIMSHELSLKFNWTGRGKEIFSSLTNVTKLILACLRKNPVTRNATESDVSSIIKVWLRTAPDRMGGRKRRGEKNTGADVEQV